MQGIARTAENRGEPRENRTGPLLAIGGGGEELNVNALLPVDGADGKRKTNVRDYVCPRL
jgi:hypothetical protein